jgi:hypothetical protein
MPTEADYVPNPKVFVSYSHDSSAHKDWVRQLATELREQGVDAILDQWDLTPGQDVVAFMQHGISEADRVIMVCSQSYVEKAESGAGGVGYERLIVTAEVSANIDTKKFLPVVRNNPTSKKIPIFLGNRLWMDFEDDEKYPSTLDDLVHDLHGVYKLVKPPLGAPKFANAAPLAAVAVQPAISIPVATPGGPDTDWFAKQSARAEAGLKALGFTGSMEVRASLGTPLAVSQKALLAAVEAAKIRTFGWPIGITLNREEWSAKSYADGIGAEVNISLETSNTGNASYDLWAASTHGDFYTRLNLFEDDRDQSAIFFNSRIIRVAESLMLLSRLYEKLDVQPSVPMTYRCTHDGLAGRTLKSAGPSRWVTPHKSVENVSLLELSVPVGEIMLELPRLVQEVCAPMFVLFGFTEFGDEIYNDIVGRFVNGEAS